MTNPASPRAAARARAPRAARRIRRALRTTALTGAALAALTAPAMASAAANPLTFDYDNSTAITAYARPTGAVVVGRNFFNPALVDQIQNGGGEVYQYVDVIDGWFTNWNATGFQAELYGGAQQNAAWLMTPRRSNWQNTYMTDMRPGSPWVLHAVDAIAKWFPTTHAKGLFLDVVGERLWTGAWSSMSATERSDWTAGNRDFVHRLRQRLGPNVILVANNTWPTGNPELNGITSEHHAYSEAGYWSTMFGRSDWDKPVRNMVIANSASEARQWANVAGVTHVVAQADYGAPVAPLLPFSLLPGEPLDPTSPPSVPTTPTVPEDPTPAPPPSLPSTPPADQTTLPSGNLLTNSSFEGSLSGWSSWNGAATVVSVPDAPHGSSVAQVRLTGSGSYTLGNFPGTISTTRSGAGYTATASVRAANSGTAGKPVTLYLRETSPSGTTVQQVHGATVSLGSGWQTVSAPITAKGAGNRIDVFVAQDKAVSGNAMQVDAVSASAVTATTDPAPPATDPAPPATPTTPTVPDDPTPVPPPSLPSTPPADAGNLLTNSSFEGSLTGWSSWNGAAAVVSVPDAADGSSVAQVRLTGSGSYTLGNFPGTISATGAGAAYTAKAAVRAANSGTVGKPVTLFLRETSPSGTTVQQVHGATVSLTSGWQTVSAPITAKGAGNRIDVFVAQDKAVSGNAMQVDAVSASAATGTADPAPTTPTTPTTPTAPTDPPATIPPPTVPSALLAGNLLTNSSFEGSLTGWSSWNGAVSSVAVSGAPDGASVAQVRLTGSGSYTLGNFPGTVSVTGAGAGYTARAYVRAANSGTVGKPVTLYLRERNAAGTTVQQVHGATVSLTTGWQAVTAPITAKGAGNRIDVFVAQDKAVSGNAMQVDAISAARS